MNQIQIDYNTIKLILNKKVISIKPILNKGDVNRVYIVKTGRKIIVIRLNEACEIQRFKKERWCIGKASEIGIPTTRVIGIGTINNTAFMILNFISGLNGKKISENKPQIWYKIGAYAKKIHSIKTGGFGEKITSPGHFNDSWEKFVKYNIESLNKEDKILSMGVINNSESEKLRRHFKSLLEKQFNFGLTHGDLSLANVIVQGDNVTLIDWGSAESTVVPHFEIISIFENSLQEDDPLFKNFISGYGMSPKDYENMKPDITSLTLLKAVDKLRWAMDQKPEMIEKFSARVRKLVSKFI